VQEFEMKLSMSRSHATHRTEERERRYPIYTAFDLALHWLLCLGVLAFAAALVGIVVMNNSPQFYSQAVTLARQIFG
jgi:hypothetical protein